MSTDADKAYFYLGAKESIERTENRQSVIAEGDFFGERVYCLSIEDKGFHAWLMEPGIRKISHNLKEGQGRILKAGHRCPGGCF